MLEGYLRALIDRYYRNYEIALKHKEALKAGVLKGICDDLMDMSDYMKELDVPKDKIPEESKGKHIELVFAGKMADLPEFLKRHMEEK